MITAGGLGELVVWVAAFILGAWILFGFASRIPKVIGRIRYEHRRRQQRAHDPYDISEEEFEAAKAHFIAKHGSIPPSLQRVIDRGGRFGMPRRRGDAWHEHAGRDPNAWTGSFDDAPAPIRAAVLNRRLP